MVVTVRSDSRFSESSRTSVVVTISGKGVSGQDGKGQGEDQFGFHGGISRFVGVVCLGCGIHPTPTILIKKRKKTLKAIVFIDVMLGASSAFKAGGWVEP
jgi:hypothetical protein